MHMCTHTHTSVLMSLQMADNSTESSSCCDANGKMAVERDTETSTSKLRQNYDEDDDGYCFTSSVTVTPSEQQRHNLPT